MTEYTAPSQIVPIFNSADFPVRNSGQTTSIAELETLTTQLQAEMTIIQENINIIGNFTSTTLTTELSSTGSPVLMASLQPNYQPQSWLINYHVDIHNSNSSNIATMWWWWNTSSNDPTVAFNNLQIFTFSDTDTTSFTYSIMRTNTSAYPVYLYAYWTSNATVGGDYTAMTAGQIQNTTGTLLGMPDYMTTPPII